MNPLVQIHPADTVAVALAPLAPGSIVCLGEGRLTITEAIEVGHKVAVQDHRPGTAVIKYGEPIGHATVAIAAGALVHTHNLASNLGEILEYRQSAAPPAARVETCAETFAGYLRPTGEVGIRNEIWIIPTVGCVNATVTRLAAACAPRAQALGLDGVYAFPHPLGCSQLGADHRNTQQILAGLARHPNAGGVLIVGLGCENNHLAAFRQVLGEVDGQRVKFLNAQDVEDEFAAGLALLDDLITYAATCTRQAVPVSRLKIGVKCGSSDGFSGITANPLVGALTDRLTACGGTVVLTEVPEMFGAESLLMARAASRGVFERLVAMINDFKRYFRRYDQPIDENPSPGNKAGGISTLEEKSLGCIQKGGNSPVADVLPYGAPLQQPGLNLLNGPGNDIVSSTAMAAAGVHLILFTTGRGTPLGSPVPTVKIATTDDLATRKPHWIDFSAGALLRGTPMSGVRDALFTLMLDVASGRVQTCQERLGARDIAMWKDGVTL